MAICEESMSMYGEKPVLPFRTYRRFTEGLRESDKEIYEYLARRGLVVEKESEYMEHVRKFNLVPAKEIEDYRIFWKNISKDYPSFLIPNIDDLYASLKLLNRFIAPDGLILDAASGNGIKTEWIRQHTNANVIGMDYIQNMTKTAKKEGKSDIILGDCEEIPIKDESATQIFLMNVSTGAINLEKTLWEMNRILKTNGKLVILETLGIRPGEKGPEKNDPAFIECYFEKCYRDPLVREEVIKRMEAIPDHNKNVRDTMGHLQRIAMEVKYDFFRSTVIPRGTKNDYLFKHPYVVCGKKWI